MGASPDIAASSRGPNNIFYVTHTMFTKVYNLHLYFQYCQSVLTIRSKPNFARQGLMFYDNGRKYGRCHLKGGRNKMYTWLSFLHFTLIWESRYCDLEFWRLNLWAVAQLVEWGGGFQAIFWGAENKTKQQVGQMNCQQGKSFCFIWIRRRRKKTWRPLEKI